VAKRIYCAGAVLGAALTAAVWLYTYRVWTTVEYIDRLGRHFHPTERVRVQPWWGVPATVGVLLIGAELSLLLLPGRRGLATRVAAHLVDLSKTPRRPRRKAGEAALRGGRTDAGADAKRHRPHSAEPPPTTAL
jgi:hypothetical protein